MQIIKFQKLSDNRYKLSFKDSEALILYDDIILKYNLLNQKNIDNVKYQKIKKDNDELTSYYQAVKYLGIKMRSKKELTTYLRKKGFLDNTINKTVCILEQEGYLNDKSYVHYYIKDQINLTLNGPIKIKKYLKDQFITEDIIDQELAKISDEKWEEKCQKIIEKRLKVNKDSRSIFLKKLDQYLYNQGYTKNLYQNLLPSIKIDDSNNFEKTAKLYYQKLSKKYAKDKLKYYLKNKLYAKGYSLEKINDFINRI